MFPKKESKYKFNKSLAELGAQNKDKWSFQAKGHIKQSLNVSFF